MNWRALAGVMAVMSLLVHPAPAEDCGDISARIRELEDQARLAERRLQDLREQISKEVEALGRCAESCAAEDARDDHHVRPPYHEPPSGRPASFSGAWSSGPWGDLTLRQTGSRVTGRYTKDPGTISGTVSGNTLRLTWTAENGDRGNAYFTLTSSTGFEGRWCRPLNCDTSRGTWFRGQKE
jgi:hypothetical protein